MSKRGRPYARIERITPGKAREWLTRKAKNRPVSEWSVDQLVDVINRDQWRLNGETIKFNTDGELEDGQYRLESVMRAGKSIESFVVYDIPKYETNNGHADSSIDVFDTIDGGKKRTTSDVLARHGVKNYNTAATAVAWVWRYTSGTIGSGRQFTPSKVQIRSLYESYTGIADSITKCKRGSTLIHGGLAAALHYLFSRVDPDKADAFFHSLFEAENLKPNTGLKALHKRLDENSRAATRLPSHYIAWLVIDAWNADYDGRPVKILKLPRDGQKFPSIRGLD